MSVIELIQLLAGVCRYNANGSVYVRVNGKTVPLGHCIDDFVDEDGERKRVVTIVPQGDDYYGE